MLMRTLFLGLITTMSSLPAMAAVDGRTPPDRMPSLMTSTEIRAFNIGLDVRHPYFIRCRKEFVIGSSVRKLRVCRTNEEWQKSADNGNQTARDLLEGLRKAPAGSQ